MGSGKAFGLIAVVFATLSLTRGFHRDGNTILFNSLGYSLVYLGSVCLITYVLLHPSSSISRVLAWRPAVFLGSVSYGFYLFHPVGDFAYGENLGAIFFSTSCSLSGLLCTL